MSEKIYLHFLILCGILCQGIIATLSNEDVRESSNLLLRKRRVINHLPGGCTATRIQEANFVAIIRENNRAACVGVILSRHTVLTAANCITTLVSTYKISAGSVYYKLNTLHNITSAIQHYGNPPHQHFDGISLLTVSPPFVFGSRIGNIQLYEGPLPTGSRVTVFGWGHNYPPQPGPRLTGQRALHSINLPIMDHVECKNIYQNHTRSLTLVNNFIITEKHLCTYDPQQYCARTDAGAPLLFNNKLVGIHVWKGEFAGGINPDVYVDFRLAEYYEWIRQNTR